MYNQIYNRKGATTVYYRLKPFYINGLECGPSVAVTYTSVGVSSYINQCVTVDKRANDNPLSRDKTL